MAEASGVNNPEIIEINDDDDGDVQNDAPTEMDVVSVGSTDTAEEDGEENHGEEYLGEENFGEASNTIFLSGPNAAEAEQMYYPAALEIPGDYAFELDNLEYLKNIALECERRDAEKKKRAVTQKLCMSVEVVYRTSGADDCNMETVLVTQPCSDLDSSGHLGDISKSCSSLTSSPTPIPQFGINRASFISSSSGSSALESASTLNRKMQEKVSPVGDIDVRRVNYLKNKWRNSDLVYVLLDYIDKIVTPGGFDEFMQRHSLEYYCKDLHHMGPTENGYQDPLRLHPSDRPSPRLIKSNELKTNQSIFLVDRKRLSSEPVLPSLSPKKVKIEHGVENLVGRDVFCEGCNTTCYFYARIIAVLNDTFAEVVFCNGKTKIAALSSIITRFSAIVGHQVTFTLPATPTSTGIVTKINRLRNTLQFVVATDDGDTLVSVQYIHLPEDRAKEVLSKIAAGSHFQVPELDQPIPSTSGTHKTHKGFQIHSSASWDSDDSSRGGDSDNHILGCDIETNVPLTTSLKLKSKSNSKDDELLGPYNVEGSWFFGSNFLITSFPSLNEPQKPVDEIETDSEDFVFCVKPFLKDRLINQIKGAGGVLYDRFEDVPPGQYSKTFLIANRPCLTPKYVKCVAQNVPVVAHDWVVRCSIEKTLLPLQELPSGWSVERKTFIERYQRTSIRPLDNFCIQFAFLDKKFYKFWSHVCRLLGAVTCQFKDKVEKVDYIVAEDGCYNSIVKLAKHKVPIVSYSWIVQTVIHGHIREVADHQSFNGPHDQNQEI